MIGWLPTTSVSVNCDGNFPPVVTGPGDHPDMAMQTGNSTQVPKLTRAVRNFRLGARLFRVFDESGWIAAVVRFR